MPDMGKPLLFTDKQLDVLSQVSEIDIEEAKLFWKSSVSSKYKTLLDAQVLDINDTTNNNLRTSSK